MEALDAKEIETIDSQEQKLGSKGIEDINKEIKNFVGEISNDKVKAEGAVKILIRSEEDFIEDAKKQIDNSVSELNNKRINFEKVVKSRLDSASESLKSSVAIFKQSYTWLLEEYRKGLMIPLAILIFLVFFYDNIANIIPSINFAVYSFPVVKVILVLIVLYFTWYSFHKLNNSFSINSEYLEKNKENIDSIKPAIEEISISKQKYEDTRPILESTKGVLETLIVNFGKSAPLINRVFSELTLLARYGKIVESFELALNYYGLFENKEFFTIRKKSAPAAAQIIDDEQVWENLITQEIIAELKKQGISASRNIILLLYREHNGFDTKNIFRNLINADNELINLSKILINSRRLVKPPVDVAYKPQDLILVFKKVGSFDLSEINNLLSSSLRKLDYLNSYVEFLNKNGVSPHFKPDIEFIIREPNDNNSSFEEQVVKLAYEVGREVFSEIPALSNEFIDGFARASISIKFHDEISLREYACKYSAKKYATAVLRAYYEKAKETDRHEAVSIKELLADSKLVGNMLDNSEDDPTFIFLETQLREGTWYDSSAGYLKDFIETKAEEIKEQISDIGNFKILKEAVTMAFQKVKIDTVEKAIDAQVFSAYVILSDSSEGNLAKLVDLISIRSANPRKRWEFKSGSEIKMIEERYGVRPNYDFIKFSDSTRIGVLDKGKSFLEFQNNFINDLKKILSNTNERFDVGLVIQRITPSKYSFGILDEKELSGNVDIKNLNVAWFIARLARDHVPIEEQASVTKFEKNIDLFEVIDTKSIYELIRAENDDIDDNEKRILEAPELKNILIKKLNENGVKNFKSLAIDLGRKRMNKANVSQIIEKVLDNRFSSLRILKKGAKNRSSILSKRMVDVLEKLALIYELHQR